MNKQEKAKVTADVESPFTLRPMPTAHSIKISTDANDIDLKTRDR